MIRRAVVTFFALAGGFASAAEPIDLSRGPQLFIDDALIASSNGIKKVTQHPQRFLDHPVIGANEHTTQPYVTVLRDAESGRFRMWYNYDIGSEAAIAYAESADGISWTLPKLDLLGPDNRLFKIGRSKDNGSYGVSVVDRGMKASEPARRYTLMWWSGLSIPPGACIAFSPDGIHWTPSDKNPVLPYYPHEDPKSAIGVGDITDLFFDPIRNRFAAMLKLHATETDGWPAGPRAGKAFRRLVGASYSDDGTHWAAPHRVITPEPRDKGLLEFYSSGGTIARGPLLVSFVRMLHDDYSPEPGGEATGLGYATLATSRDGEHWLRHDDIFFDRNPQPGTWDRAMTWIGSSVIVGDEIYLYYGGYARGHKVEPTKERQIGLAKMPLDRYVSVEPADQSTATLKTVLLSALGKAAELIVNADARGGQLRVRAVSGETIPGYSFDDCTPITSDGVRTVVQWTGGKSLPKDLTFQLEFELTNAKLFSFDIKQPTP